jgi:hypothetical protein
MDGVDEGGGVEPNRRGGLSRTLRASWAWAPAVLALLAAGTIAGAWAALPRAGEARSVDVPLSRLNLQPWRDGQLYGVLAARDLPPYRLTWEGRPPRAQVVERASGRVVAPAVLRWSSLEANRDAVLWSRPDAYRLRVAACQVVLEEEAVEPGLVLRFEVPDSRRKAARRALLGVALLLLAGTVWAARRIVRTPADRRLATLWSLGVAALAVGLAAVAFLLHFPGSPWSEAETDSASIQSFAAARDRPAAFEHDALLSDPANVSWYTPLYVGTARASRALGLGYGAGFALFAFLATLSGFLGFERLFREISGSPLFGLAGALAITLLSRGYPPNEHWAFGGALPRDLFAGLLPWVVLLAARERERPARWYLPAAAAALLFYVHPVSSPALSSAVLLGLALGSSAPWRRRILGLAGATAATLAVMLPYAWRYASAYERSVSGPAPSLQGLRTIFAPLQPGAFTSRALSMFLHEPRFWVLAAALALLVAPALARRPGAGAVRMLWGALAGLLIVTFLVPALDWRLAERLGRLPFQIDLPRNLRYLEVILVAALGLVVSRPGRPRAEPVVLDLRLDLRGGLRQGRRRSWLAGRAQAAPAALAGVAVLALLYGGSMARSTVAAASRSKASWDALHGELDDVPAARLEMVWAVEAFRRPEQRVLVPFDLDFLRQLSIPLAPTWKDPGTLSYSNPAAMRSALEARRRVDELRRPPVTRRAVREMSARADAQLVALERWRAAPGLQRACKTRFRNDRYVLWDETACTILPASAPRDLR